MPEVKNNFTSGKMNKDLDERLVPKDQYRDALNLDITTSEGGDVGAFESSFGNYNMSPDVSAYFIDAKCIGSFADKENERIIWFVYSDLKDAIIEYHDDGTVIPILVDKNKDVLLVEENCNLNSRILNLNLCYHLQVTQIIQNQ